MTQGIITSLLDTDLYKLTMMQCIFHQLKPIEVEYAFYCRKPVSLGKIAEQLKTEINHLCSLRFSSNELHYLSTLPYFKQDFIDFLSGFQLQPRHILIDTHDNLQINVKGNWLDTILFEVPLLAIISEIYYQQQFPAHTLEIGRQHLQAKINLLSAQPDLAGFSLTDFGTRRRYSKLWQQEVIKTLQTRVPQYFSGTSNLYFAKLFHLTPIGTMAHEYLQAFQAISSDLQHAQTLALQRWQQEYQQQLSIALTDVLGVDQFLKEFTPELSRSYAGLRHDSGDPFAWVDKVLHHYQTLDINSQDKTLVFSDSLTMQTAIDIYRYVKRRAKTTFGIGTHLTNDVGLTPLDIVIKMTKANGVAVIKYPDSKGKTICVDPARLNLLKTTLQLD